jgi:dolichyl-phosphate beta-glucosyltransferase
VELSLVIPAYNEAGRIGATVTHVCGYLDRQPYGWEVIVVIDGGPKTAADEARGAAGARANVGVMENDTNRGKGYSVRRGFAEARGDRLVFIDADLSLPIDGLDAMLSRFDLGADIVIASRTAPGSRIEGAPPAMHDVMSKVFNLAVQAFAVPGISDTQCGFKGFTAHAAKKIFSVADRDRFGFDVEALYLAKRFGFRIDELPVVCRYHGGSSVSRISDGVRMFADIVAIRRRHK